MAVIGELATLVTAKTEPFTKGLKKAGQQATTFSGTIKTKLGGALSGLGRALSSTTGMLAGFGGAAVFTGFVAKSVKLASAAEDMQTAYATYLKDLTKAKGLIEQLDKYSGATPFQSMELKEAGKQLLAFGFESKNIMSTITVLGDIAAGSQKPIADFVDILGKIKASGIASMGDINRLADRGVPIFQELAKVMGVASTEVRGLVGSAKVGFDDVWQAMKNVTAEGGLFAGAVENLSQTASGKLSTLKDNIDKIFVEVGTSIMQGLDVKAITDQLTEMAKTYKQDIVEITQAGITAVKGALDLGGNLARQGSMASSLFQMGYHGSVMGLRRLQIGTANLLGSDVVAGTRESLEYHRRGYYDAMIRGDEVRTRIESDQVADILRQQNARSRAGGGQADDRMQRQQTQTLDDIYREQQRQNEIALRQYELMRQQNYGYVGTF